MGSFPETNNENVEEGKIQILVSLIFLPKEVSFRVNGKEMS